MSNFSEKISTRQAVVCVVGLGRVGLPLATVFSKKGMDVIGIDVDSSRIDSIKNSQCPFFDPKVQEYLEEAIKSDKLQVYTDLQDSVKEPDIIIISVGTPLKTDNMVDYSHLYGALEHICKINLLNKLIILRSTLPPNTTSDIAIPYLESKTNMKCGTDFFVAMCPERILEGHAIEEIYELPEIVGGINDVSNELVTELFKIINPDKEFLYTTPSSAEMAKLFTNIYRYISFALSNEFAIWAEKYGLDANEIIKIANHNYKRSNIPIPGFAGGPCLSKDGIFLDQNTTFASIVSTAWKMNESVPQHISNNIKEVMGSLFNKNIAMLGISFKAGSDDTRQSPSVKLAEILVSYGANVSIHDPHVINTKSLDEVLKNSDMVVLATNHQEFKNIVDKINNCSCKFVYDVWGFYDKNQFTSNITYNRFGEGIH